MALPYSINTHRPSSALLDRVAAGIAWIRVDFNWFMLEPEPGVYDWTTTDAVIREARAAFEASGRGDLLAEAYRLQGTFLLRQAPPEAAQAEACFQQAIALARRQQAKSYALWTAISLSRLWQQGKRDEAHQLLAPLYGWFTEGFDTADLQEARALIEELS
jgi:predicted ATPase